MLFAPMSSKVSSACRGLIAVALCTHYVPMIVALEVGLLECKNTHFIPFALFLFAVE